MRMSELDYDKLTEKQQYELVTKNIFYGSFELKKAKFLKTAIVVLGANTDSIKERMLTAIELLKKGYGSHIIVTDNFEPKIKDVEDGNFDIENVPEEEVHKAQTQMIEEIAEIFGIHDDRMLYYSDDMAKQDKRVENFDRYILVTLYQNVRRAIQRCAKCYPNKRFVGCATIRDFAEWNLDNKEAKHKYSAQIKDEAKNLIEYTKKGYLADMNVDYIFEGEKKWKNQNY